MTYELKLPELGEDAGDEATISYWHFEQGDHVGQDEDLVEMSTDKAVFAVPSPVSGTIVEIVAEAPGGERQCFIVGSRRKNWRVCRRICLGA